MLWGIQNVAMFELTIAKWMDEWQPKCKYDIAETCCSSISVDQLQELSEDQSTNVLQPGKKLDYGEIRGSKELRSNLARLYSSKVGMASLIHTQSLNPNDVSNFIPSGNPLPEENILITPGAIAANHLVFYSLIGPGDHVVCHYPTYQQLYAVPASLGAEVDFWKADPAKNWIPDIEDLKKLIKPNTKMIVIK
jgi:hypothetical protein